MPIQASWIANDGTVYAGVGPTLFKSLNQGVTWQPTITFNTTTSVGVSNIYVSNLNYVFATPGTGAVASNLGIWRSTNGGQTWTKVLSLTTSCTISYMDEDSRGTLFASGYTTDAASNARIYRSTDGGATWVSVYYDSAARHVHCVTVDDSNNYLYASVGDLLGPWNIAYVLRSTDGGNSWSKILAGIPQIVAVKAVPGARLFATDSPVDGQIYRTTDDKSYNLVLDTGQQSYGYWIRTNNLNGYIYTSFIAGEHPTQWVSGIWVSTNNGVSWSVYKTFPIHYAYYGSAGASNFVQGTMYYCVQWDSGWQNGVKIYPYYGNSFTQNLNLYAFAAAGLQLELSMIKGALLSPSAIPILTALQAALIFPKRKLKLPIPSKKLHNSSTLLS